MDCTTLGQEKCITCFLNKGKSTFVAKIMCGIYPTIPIGKKYADVTQEFYDAGSPMKMFEWMNPYESTDKTKDAGCVECFDAGGGISCLWNCKWWLFGIAAIIISMEVMRRH